jgi:hypothetical protein
VAEGAGCGLVLQGHEVIVIDNMFTGRKKNVAHWIGHPNFMLMVHDVVEPLMLEVRADTPTHWQCAKGSIFSALPDLALSSRACWCSAGAGTALRSPRLWVDYNIHVLMCPPCWQVDQIYHLACPASPPHYQYNPIKTIKTSTMGTLNMLGLAKRVRARMLLTSTSEVRKTSGVTPPVAPVPERRVSQGEGGGPG